MSKFFYNIGAATVARVITNALGLVVVAVLARVLGSEAFGQYHTVFAYLFLFNALADMGLYTLLVREISRPGAEEEHIVGNLFMLRLVIVTVLLILANAVVQFLPYDRTVQLGVMIGSISIACSSMVQVLLGVFQKHLKLYLVSFSDVVARLVQLGCVALLVLRGHSSLLAFIWVVVLSEIIHVIFILYFARRITRFSLRMDMAFWRQSLRTAFPMALSLIFVLIYFKIDTVMLSLMTSDHDVAMYSIAYKVLEVAIFFPALYVGLIMPALSRTASVAVEFKEYYKKALRVLTITAIPTIAGIFIFTPFITKVIGGAEYGDAVGLLRILSVAVGIIFFGNLGGNALVALDLQRSAAWIYGLGALVNVAANALLIPRYGAPAAAWTTVATELIVTIGMFWVITRALRSKTQASEHTAVHPGSF